MLKRVLVAGVLGGLVLFLWTSVLNVGFGFSNRVMMNRVANEPEVYLMLKQHITQPGAYVVNPAADPRVGFPPGEPVFGVQYSGIGHEAAGPAFLTELVMGLITPLLVAWLLSMASAGVLSRYGRRVLFVAVIGLAIAVESDLQRAGIGGYALHTALLLGARDLIGWLLAGLVIARFMRPVGDTGGSQ